MIDLFHFNLDHTLSINIMMDDHDLVVKCSCPMAIRWKLQTWSTRSCAGYRCWWINKWRISKTSRYFIEEIAINLIQTSSILSMQPWMCFDIFTTNHGMCSLVLVRVFRLDSIRLLLPRRSFIALTLCRRGQMIVDMFSISWISFFTMPKSCWTSFTDSSRCNVFSSMLFTAVCIFFIPSAIVVDMVAMSFFTKVIASMVSAVEIRGGMVLKGTQMLLDSLCIWMRTPTKHPIVRSKVASYHLKKIPLLRSSNRGSNAAFRYLVHCSCSEISIIISFSGNTATLEHQEESMSDTMYKKWFELLIVPTLGDVSLFKGTSIYTEIKTRDDNHTTKNPSGSRVECHKATMNTPSK